jgi:hypothetical protein
VVSTQSTTQTMGRFFFFFFCFFGGVSPCINTANKSEGIMNACSLSIEQLVCLLLLTQATA